ncbi:hypothetical protein [Desulfoluna spongiiphila]|uniref:Uncharacterized protein n=1 Tax=Desulfoluna spongiiphila TaxID=419481 RepID=A0A1G5J930_9BACT|nr:hypothetical protein [Desulfoluna spongiiphila]SCY84339.1 hypothetical protein SAMN05216233_12610 [Desulfoluna spongiiphila]
MTLNIEEIISTIHKTGCSLENKSEHKNGPWTHAIKQSVADYIRKNDESLSICIGDSQIDNKDCGEWLYDISAVRLTEDNHHLISVELIIESEWGNVDEIIHDFQKLLQARSQHKVMIFQDTSAPYYSIFVELEKQVALYQDAESGEEYHLLCWKNKDPDHGFQWVKLVK